MTHAQLASLCVFHFSSHLLIQASPSSHLPLLPNLKDFSQKSSFITYHLEDLFPFDLVYAHCASQKLRSISCYCLSHPDMRLRSEYDLAKNQRGIYATSLLNEGGR